MTSTFTKPKALLLGILDHAFAAWNDLSSLAELTSSPSTSRAEFIAECRAGLHDGVMVICDRAPASMKQTGPIDQELIGELPNSVRFICHNGTSGNMSAYVIFAGISGYIRGSCRFAWTDSGRLDIGAGYDSIDINACTSRNILVSNVPLVVEESTADTAIFLILAALRGFNNGIMAIRAGTWLGKVPPGPLGHDPQGKVLGILGMGGIGRNLKRKAEVFGMRCIYHNRKELSPSKADGAEYVGFDELLAGSDVLSLNLPLNAKTRNIISTNEFGKMKRGIVIVNTARGGVLDEEALVVAIEAGIVRSVGLDVFQNEPHIHPELVGNPHVCLLPHMGTSTVETKTAMEEVNVGNVRAALELGRLKNVVIEQQHLV